VAVVLAEALGKTEWQFAVAMTNKARQLGMRKTVFRNASGLPDVRQITTARDMATLSLALRRDFPEYYHFFKESSFSYRGRKYNGHNHVLTRMQGVDGLKTGYINMSGFNLASSIKRNGYSLVAVVLGGRTAKRRDNHMVNLLGRSLRQIASIRPPIKNTQFVRGNTPVPVLKPGSEPIQVTDVAIPVANPRRADETVQIANHAVPPVTAGIAAGTPRGWGIQVGAYADSQDAFFAAVNAMNVASRELQGSEITERSQ
ncbi:MAG: D-alanyl-D-alanine carboxypeptidase family protein, partial [Rickettsiales bacterium]